MTTSGKLDETAGGSNADDPIAAYSQASPPALRPICDLLRELIDTSLPNATAKVWYGNPVWFIDDNLVVGYNISGNAVKLLFWNGKAFQEPDLKPVGKYMVAEAVFCDAADIEPRVIRRWLRKAKGDVLDAQVFFKKQREENDDEPEAGSSRE